MLNFTSDPGRKAGRFFPGSGPERKPAPPRLAAVAQQEENAAAGPIRGHAVPDALQPQVQRAAQQVAEAHAEHPHGHDADDHGVLHVTGGPVHVGEHEGGGPQGGTDHRGKQQHPAGQGPGLFRQVVELEDQGNGQGEDQVDGDVAEECQAKQAQGVVAHLSFLPRAEAAGDDGHRRRADGSPGQDLENPDGVAHGVGCDGHRAEGGDQADHHDLSELEHGVFNAVGNADAQNTFHRSPFQPEAEGTREVEGVFLPPQKQQHHHGGHDPGEEGGDGRTLDLPAQPVNQKGVAGDVHRVHEEGDQHGGAGIRHGAENGRTAVIQGDEGDGEQGDGQVGIGIPHHLLGDGAEHRAQDHPPQEEQGGGDHGGDQEDQQDQLV